MIKVKSTFLLVNKTEQQFKPHSLTDISTQCPKMCFPTKSYSY